MKNVNKVLIPYRPTLNLLNIKIGTVTMFIIVHIKYFIHIM
jgi:hypothetical protein